MAQQVATIVEIIKRDGTREPFDEERILDAIRKAQTAVGQVDAGAARDHLRPHRGLIGGQRDQHLLERGAALLLSLIHI